MKKIKILLASIALILSVTSCTNESLQSYLVKSQEKSGFVTFDIPANILQLKSDTASDATKKALNSLKKINIVALPFKDNAAELEAERAKISSILKKSEYKSLMRFTEKNMKIRLYYTGSENAIDEIIAFGYGATQGVGIARIIGEDINPSEIVKMMRDVKFDSKGANLESFKAIFSAKK
ncbi:MAG: DUF4252 domain-containing protein [Polaribacter sp.]|nr:DUF4252 domain-containing protein [Polaribacter sp.]